MAHELLRTTSILETIVYRGELPCDEVAGILGASDRHVRRVVSSLSEWGNITGTVYTGAGVNRDEQRKPT